MISFDGETDCSVIYDLKRRENIAYNDVKFPSPIRARQGFTAVNPQSYDAGFWHSFCVQKKLFIPKTRVIIELNDVKLPRLYAEVNLSMAKVEVMTQDSTFNIFPYFRH